jgi:hypothetical protein
MKLNNFLNERTFPKVKIKVPTKITNIVTDIIKIEKHPVRKKRLQELKGILVGKYPNAQTLFNSLKGLKKKMSTISEAKLSRRQKTGVGLLAALMTITTLLMPTAKAAASKPVDEAPPTKKVEAPISDVEARVLSIGVKQEVWDKIYQELQDYLQKLISAEYSGAEAHRELANVLNKYNIGFEKLPQRIGGRFDQAKYEQKDPGRITLNWNTLMKLAKGQTTLERVFGTLRHEVTHREQFNMLKSLLSREKYVNFLKSELSRNYVNRIIEIGAFREELRGRLQGKNLEQAKKILNTISSSIKKSIVMFYPQTDAVAKIILAAEPNIETVIKYTTDKTEQQMKIAKDMVDKYQGIQKILENPGKVFQEEKMDWEKTVRDHLKEAKDPDRVRGGSLPLK